MKKINSISFLVVVALGLLFFSNSCMKDLLDRPSTVELPSSAFWQTESDATTALMGAYSSIRPLFDRDYYFEGQGEYVRVRGTSTTNGNLRLGDAYQGGNYNPSGYGSSFDKYFRYLYGGVNRANYVIENVSKMLPTANASSLPALEAVIGEARLLRGMVYFRLISMWGDVQYFSKVINDNSEVAQLERIPIKQVKDSILADFTYAYEKLPAKGSANGRAGKPAALAFRGKLQLYWACWNNFGWPELDTFTPSASEATAAYAAAAADFKDVIDNYGLKLFRDGQPGEIGALGEANVLPNYFYLFIPNTGNPNSEGEMIMVFTHGGTGTAQGEELMRDVAGRSHEGSQCWVHPRYEIADRYQSTITGDFVSPLIPMAPTSPNARTTPNSAVNPKSYENRDYRMKASIMWDYEMSEGMQSLKSTGLVPFIYKTWNANVNINGKTYISYNTDGCNSGYVFRKFLRNYAGQGRSDGDYNWPVMRLADVYLMYAEASNEINGPQPYAIELVNRVRHRGNLPPLTANKTSDKENFFAAIEQERIVELVGEGHRGFDIRRWRALERVWVSPYDGNGVWRRDTHGGNMQRYFQNASELAYQQNYIFRIPPSERERNPNLTQNKPWL